MIRSTPVSSRAPYCAFPSNDPPSSRHWEVQPMTPCFRQRTAAHFCIAKLMMLLALASASSLACASASRMRRAVSSFRVSDFTQNPLWPLPREPEILSALSGLSEGCRGLCSFRECPLLPRQVLLFLAEEFCLRSRDSSLLIRRSVLQFLARSCTSLSAFPEPSGLIAGFPVFHAFWSRRTLSRHPVSVWLLLPPTLSSLLQRPFGQGSPPKRPPARQSKVLSTASRSPPPRNAKNQTATGLSGRTHISGRIGGAPKTFLCLVSQT